jgi:hypothetical protein
LRGLEHNFSDAVPDEAQRVIRFPGRCSAMQIVLAAVLVRLGP